jgi:hypothetical protein
LQQLISNITAFISKDQLDPSLQTTRSDLETKIGHELKDQVEALLYNSASLNVQLAHEKNYNVIFGSQLQLLAQANIDFGMLPTTAKAIQQSPLIQRSIAHLPLSSGLVSCRVAA